MKLRSFASWLYETVEKDDHGFVHKTNIDGHDLHVQFSPIIGKKAYATAAWKVHGNTHPSEHSYRVDYDIGGKHNGKQTDPKTGAKIIRHVGGVIGRFMKTHNPRGMYFRGNTDEKHDMYRSFTKRLGKIHGGEVKLDPERSDYHSWHRK